MQSISSVRVSLVKEGEISIYSRKFANSEFVFKWANEALFSDADREQFYVLILNTKNIMTGINLVSIGSINTSVVHPREVMKAAIIGNAAAMLFIHNHPSGDPAPSIEDIDCTKRLTAAAKILGIRVLDHVICGDSQYYSFADAGNLN